MTSFRGASSLDEEELFWKQATSKEEEEEDYDTDLEEEDRPITPFDDFGIRSYNRLCRKLKIKPIPTVPRDLKTSRLCVQFRDLSVKDMKALATALAENSTVRSLVFEDNNLSAKVCQEFVSHINGGSNIDNLAIVCNRLDIHATECICGWLLHNNSVKDFRFSENGFTDAHFTAIEPLLIENHTVENLNLSKNKFSLETARHLSHCFEQNDFLHTVDLSWNLFNADGIKFICTGLQGNRGIKKLSLASNGLGNIGSKYVAQMLKENETLLELNLTCTKIGEVGACSIGKALQVNQTLQKLQMSENPLTSVGVMALLSSCLENQEGRLKYLEILGVGVNTLLMETYRDVRQLHPHFTLIYSSVVDDPVPIVSPKVQLTINQDSNALKAFRFYLTSKHRAMLKDLRRQDGVTAEHVSVDAFKASLEAVKIPFTERQIEQLIVSSTGQQTGEPNLRCLVPDKDFPPRPTGPTRDEAFIDS